MKSKLILFVLLQLAILHVQAQVYSIYGRITADGKGVHGAVISLVQAGKNAGADKKGNYGIDDLAKGKYELIVSAGGYDSVMQRIVITDKNVEANVMLNKKSTALKSVTVKAGKDNTLGITRLKDVDGTAIYAGKKSEVVVMKDIAANKATNSSRQIYAKVAGLNIWENDVAGLQLGIGGRGLNPSRVTNFNTRQNGYDISADALGYPESYYTPPAEMVEQIEIVRGAASLQYGTQFGGLINFKLNRGADTQKVKIVNRETGGSWNFFNSSTSIGGTVKKLNYYVFYQHKQGDGWRPNSQFSSNTAYASVTWKANEKLSVTAQYTFMSYLAHQPGGLTDAEFAQDPMQSVRSRNWFKVNWNLGAVMADYAIASNLKLNTRFFGLVAGRDAVGNLTYISRPDVPGSNRDLFTDKYRNFGNETRLLYTYHSKGEPYTLLVGSRFYDGHTDRRQGIGNNGSGGTKGDFEYSNDNNLDYSRYNFPNYNTSVFAENIFRINRNLSIIPGVRYENIVTSADGFYTSNPLDMAGNSFFHQEIAENRVDKRSFVIGGIGVSYYRSTAMQFYANISQNYRAINFNDMHVVNINSQVDPNLKDEKGYSADMGMRGRLSDVFYYDVSVFTIDYANRIGSIIKADTNFNIYRYRTNIGQSRNLGVESFAEVDIWKLIKKEQAKMKLSVFSNLSLIDARYIDDQVSAFRNKKVELVPGVIFKTGVTFRKNKFTASYQFAYTGKQFTDATNAISTPYSVDGLIPAYFVMDLNLEYAFNRTFTLYGSINNLTDNRYFTRRADSYPGPGIIPADARAYYLTLQVTL